MSERDQDHWQSLLSQLGAEPQTPPARPARKQATEEPRRTAAAPRVVPPATDWTQVAKQLGVASAEPLASEVLKRRISDDAQWVEAVREAAEAVALEPEKARPARERPRDESLTQERSTEARLTEERRAETRPARETPAGGESAPHPPAPSGGFGKGIFEAEPAEPLSAEAAPGWLEEVEEQPQDRPRRRRRRGRSKPGGRESVEEGAPAEAIADKATEPRESAEDALTSQPEERPRRRRRRRGRRDDVDRPRREEAPLPATDDSQDEEALDETVDVLAADNNQPHESAEKVAADDEDQPRDEAEHRNIPSWEEAIGVIIGKNMEARQKSPGGYRPRGRSRGRG
jgi:hypothetical protein